MHDRAAGSDPNIFGRWVEVVANSRVGRSTFRRLKSIAHREGSSNGGTKDRRRLVSVVYQSRTSTQRLQTLYEIGKEVNGYYVRFGSGRLGHASEEAFGESALSPSFRWRIGGATGINVHG